MFLDLKFWFACSFIGDPTLILLWFFSTKRNVVFCNLLSNLSDRVAVDLQWFDHCFCFSTSSFFTLKFLSRLAVISYISVFQLSELLLIFLCMLLMKWKLCEVAMPTRDPYFGCAFVLNFGGNQYQDMDNILRGKILYCPYSYVAWSSYFD